MFQWHYFIIYVFLGFASGYTNPDVPPHRTKPIQNIFWLVVVITAIAVLINFASFDFFWGFLSIIEVAIGYFIGRRISLGSNP
tara:strand:- start:895 stop:1143 length:249 start_codon:yes stop_codon:yes gene_type:complete